MPPWDPWTPYCAESSSVVATTAWLSRNRVRQKQLPGEGATRCTRGWPCISTGHTSAELVRGQDRSAARRWPHAG